MKVVKTILFIFHSSVFRGSDTLPLICYKSINNLQEAIKPSIRWLLIKRSLERKQAIGRALERKGARKEGSQKGRKLERKGVRKKGNQKERGLERQGAKKEKSLKDEGFRKKGGQIERGIKRNGARKEGDQKGRGNLKERD